MIIEVTSNQLWLGFKKRIKINKNKVNSRKSSLFQGALRGSWNAFLLLLFHMEYNELK
jgi:hypothetical protein